MKLLLLNRGAHRLVGRRVSLGKEIVTGVRLGSYQLPPSCCRVTESQTGDMDGSTRRQCACFICLSFCDKPCAELAAGMGLMCSRCAKRECEGFKAAAAKPYLAIEEHDEGDEVEVRPLSHPLVV
jgi:hypothetical protein